MVAHLQPVLLRCRTDSGGANPTAGWTAGENAAALESHACLQSVASSLERNIWRLPKQTRSLWRILTLLWATQPYCEDPEWPRWPPPAHSIGEGACCWTTSERKAVPPSTHHGTHHLQKGQVPGPHVVKVDFHLGPVQFASHVERLTVALVVHNGIVQGHVSLGLVDAPPKLPREEVHAHDAEDEPEDEADEKDVHDGWDGAHQGVDHNLKWAENRLSFWGCSECTPSVRCPSPNLLNPLGIGPCGGRGGEHFLSPRKDSPWLEALVGSEREHTRILLCIP